jgi:thiamine pyrophosphate-dependent acetolactate synthase large subunit-like protein
VDNGVALTVIMSPLSYVVHVDLPADVMGMSAAQNESELDSRYRRATSMAWKNIRIVIIHWRR